MYSETHCCLGNTGFKLQSDAHGPADTDKRVFTYETYSQKLNVASADIGFKLQIDAHAEEFLAQQLGPIRHINPNDVVSRLADPAIWTPDLTAASQCSLDNVSNVLAFLANMHLRRVAESKEALMQVG